MAQPSAVTDQPPRYEEVQQMSAEGGGLEYLANLGEIKVVKDRTFGSDGVPENHRRCVVLNKQDHQIYEVQAGWDGDKMLHTISLNALGQRQVIMTDESVYSYHECCAEDAPKYTMKVKDAAGHDMGLVRPIENDCCEARISICEARETCSLYTIYTPMRQAIVRPVNFPIYKTSSNIQVANICCELGQPGIHIFFPMDMTLQHKALILSATLLIDLMYRATPLIHHKSVATACVVGGSC